MIATQLTFWRRCTYFFSELIPRGAVQTILWVLVFLFHRTILNTKQASQERIISKALHDENKTLLHPAKKSQGHLSNEYVLLRLAETCLVFRKARQYSHKVSKRCQNSLQVETEVPL